ncbi:MAG TPA: class F sortase [Ktedonobacterales bacterium]|nr:class F sortase [Ktedonobacterales bacterium]
MREPRESIQPPRHTHARGVWLSIWTVIGVVGALSIILPLALTPGVTPQARARQVAQATATPTFLPSPSPTPTPTFYPPVRLTSSKARINASVIPVGEDAHGAMLAPEGPNSDPIWFTTFWWKYGAKPGQIGNAVIAGHLDRKDGSPAVFWWLRLLRVGDSVYVRTSQGTTLRYVVTDVEIYLNPTSGPNDPVLQRIFGPAKTANLNLITCAGDWTGKEYTKKLVVYTTLAS